MQNNHGERLMEIKHYKNNYVDVCERKPFVYNRTVRGKEK